MRSNLKKVQAALNDTEWATQKANEAAMAAYATLTRTFFEEARAAAEEARLCADALESAALDDLDPDEADDTPEIWELHTACMSAVKQARSAAEEAEKACSGEPRATLAAERLAQKCLGIETLETQYSDELDFHEVSVWGLAAALEQAYRAGLKDGRTAR